MSNDLRQSLRELSRTVRRHRALLAAGLAAAAVAAVATAPPTSRRLRLRPSPWSPP